MSELGHVGILTAFNARIAGHRATGKLLATFAWHDGPQTYAKGYDDFPSVACWLPESSETAADGTVDSDLTLNYVVSVARSSSSVALEAAKQTFLNALDVDPVTMRADRGSYSWAASTLKVGAADDSVGLHAWIQIKITGITQVRGERT
jgi:hypothetical protein